MIEGIFNKIFKTRGGASESPNQDGSSTPDPFKKEITLEEIAKLPPNFQILAGICNELRNRGIDPSERRDEVLREFREVLNSWLND